MTGTIDTDGRHGRALRARGMEGEPPTPLAPHKMTQETAC
jgi:hypothetical protein